MGVGSMIVACLVGLFLVAVLWVFFKLLGNVATRFAYSYYMHSFFISP